MAADALSSASITNLDASPIVANTTGAGAPYSSKVFRDYVTPTTGGLASTSSKYKMVRLPVYAKVEEIFLNADGNLDSSTGLVLDVGAYWSDSTTDGTPANLQGTVISVNCFAALLTFQASFKFVHADTAWTAANRQLPLWKALGISANAVTGAPPSGFIDVVVAVHTVATAAVSNPLEAIVQAAV